MSETETSNERKEGTIMEQLGNGVKRFMVFECAFAVMIILLISGYLFGITFLEVPEANSRVVDTVLDFLLGSVVSPIIIWAFKSSKHTVDKERRNETTTLPKPTEGGNSEKSI